MNTNRKSNARVVAFGNQKGGVTKTSTVINLAAALSEIGRRVLIWDLDVNCGSTRLSGLPEEMNVYGTYEVMVGDESPEEVIIKPGDHEKLNLPENVHLIAAHTKLEGVEASLAEKIGPFEKPWEVLKKPIQALAPHYDYIFLDTAPSMTLPTKAAYVAADYFVLTATPEKLAIEGLVNAIRYIEHARASGNPELRLMGVVMNQVPGRETRLSRAIMDQVDRHFGSGDPLMRRYESSISAATIVPMVQQQGTSLFKAAPDHKVTEQYRALARELEARFAEIHPGSQVESKPIDAATSPSVKEVANG